MDSPTMEISQGLEALRLAGSKERLPNLVANSTLPESQCLKQLEQNKTTSITEPVNLEDEVKRVIAQRNRLLEAPPFTRNPAGSDRQWRSLCTEDARESEDQYQYCHSRQHNHHHNHCHHHQQKRSDHKYITSLSSCKCEESTDSIIDSFGTLHVSNNDLSLRPLSTTTSHSSVTMPRSCRAEATSSAAYLDDTTVDDLAGYLDEIMFLPKPMSEMAELMYT